MARETRVHRITAGGLDDMSRLTAAVQSGVLDPAAIVAILGKTEGASSPHWIVVVAGGAEHQGPDGGGPVAIIARRADRRRAS